MACRIHLGNNKPTDNRHYLLKISGAAYSVVNLDKIIIENNRRTRQTLWRAVQMLTQKLCCQTIHDCPKVVPLHYESEWQ